MNFDQIYDIYAQKIADVTRVPYQYIVALRDMGALDMKSTRDILIRHDYFKLKKTERFTERQIFENLAASYSLELSTIYNIVKKKIKTVCYCRECGCQLSKPKFIENCGLCDKCIALEFNI